MYRKLTASTETATRYLASTLTNHSAQLAVLGRFEEAVAASTEAVTIYRELATGRPDAFSRRLAARAGHLNQVVHLDEPVGVLADPTALLAPTFIRRIESDPRHSQSNPRAPVMASTEALATATTTPLETVGRVEVVGDVACPASEAGENRSAATVVAEVTESPARCASQVGSRCLDGCGAIRRSGR